MSKLSNRVRDERGIAMVVAMGSLMVILLLTAVIATAAGQFTSASNNSTNAKRALEAANAGLDTALYRLNTLDPDQYSCLADQVLTGQVITSTLNGGYCGPSSWESAGNGESFQYYTSMILSLGGHCAGVSVVNDTVVQRCVTAVGCSAHPTGTQTCQQAGGIQRRLEERTAAYGGKPVFPIDGVLGLASVTLNNGAQLLANGTFPTTVATNGLLTLDNNSSSTAAQLGPSATTKILGGASPCTGYPSTNCIGVNGASTGNFVLSPVDFGNTDMFNDDWRIGSTPPLDPSGNTGTVTWNAATRSLSLDNGASLTLGGGVYNFCSLSLNNGSTLNISVGPPDQPPHKVAIYIDSPYRTGATAPCPATSGTLTVGNGATLVNNSNRLPNSTLDHDSTALQLYIYGNPTKPGSNVVSLNQGSAFWGVIDAPNSLVSIDNRGDYYGAIGGYSVSFNNGGTFTGDPNDSTIKSNTVGLSFVSTWRECTPQPTSSDPTSGC